jgi:hypothetical protein
MIYNVDESLHFAQAKMGLEVRRPIVTRAVRSQHEESGKRFANHRNSRRKCPGDSKACWPIPRAACIRGCARQDIHKPGGAKATERNNLGPRPHRESSRRYAR